MAETVKITFNAEQREFVETLLRQQRFQGNLVQMQQWTQLQDEALTALHVEAPGHGRTFTCSVECADFMGMSLQNTQYQGTLDVIRQIQAIGVSAVGVLNKALAPIHRKRERATQAAAAKAAKDAADTAQE